MGCLCSVGVIFMLTIHKLFKYSLFLCALVVYHNPINGYQSVKINNNNIKKMAKALNLHNVHEYDVERLVHHPVDVEL